MHSLMLKLDLAFFWSFVFFSYHHPNSQRFHTVAWEAQERRREAAQVWLGVLHLGEVEVNAPIGSVCITR